MKQQYYAFPGDNELAYDALWRTHRGYLAAVEYAKAAALSSGVKVSPGTLERWFRIGGYAYLLDRLIDDQPLDKPWRRDEAREIYKKLVCGEILHESDLPAWVNPDLLKVASLFDNSMEEIGIDSARRHALEFPTYATVKATEQYVGLYGTHVAGEGRLLAWMIAECMTSYERRGRQYRRFRNWFSHFAAGGALFDSICDLDKDYRSHRTKVVPSKMNRLVLFVHFLATCMKMALHPKILGSTFAVIPKFWGVPFRLRDSWGRPAALWYVKEREAYASVVDGSQ